MNAKFYAASFMPRDTELLAHFQGNNVHISMTQIIFFLEKERRGIFHGDFVELETRVNRISVHSTNAIVGISISMFTLLKDE